MDTPHPLQPDPATQAVAARYAALTALVTSAQTLPHMVYMTEVIALVTALHACLGEVLQALGIPVTMPDEGVFHANPTTPE